ncbi:MAG: hypothetical protein ACXU8N_08765 [Telluria sp.]
MKRTLIGAAVAAAFAFPVAAHAADDKDLAAIRAEIAQMKQDYEARLAALEQRLQDAQAALAQAQNNAAPAAAAAAPEPAPPPAPAATTANAFNPAISLILGGTLSNLQRDPATWRLGGFLPPAGETGPGKRSFSLGESELTMAANIDPMFSGQLTFSLGAENDLSVEEAFVQTRALDNGVNLRAGRFLSSVGYLNSQHAHAWDFVDAPLAYQAFFGGQYKPDGLQLKWLAPTDTFVELGAEVGNGTAFPGSERNKNGSGAFALYGHVGGDIGDTSSWRAGLSLLRTRADNRAFDENGVPASFSGPSRLWLADAIYKWAPNGNPTQQNFKLQGEYLRRHESGTLALDSLAGAYDSTQSGWYLQGVYQWMAGWRAGLRYDRLDSGTPLLGLDAALFPALAAYRPARTSVMVDWSPSEFSRVRLQLAQDKARRGQTDNQLYLQYIMSLGTHAAHQF